MDESIVGLIIIGGVLWGISAGFFGEREGIVKISDCRETVTLPSDTWQKYYKTFTCSYDKTNSGAIMRGACAHIDTAGTIFSSSNACSAAYVYQIKNLSCSNKSFPYIGRDDKCYAQYQY